MWGSTEKERHGIDHARAGDLIAVAKENAWFTYYYWLDDQRAPDFARTVDIHRKPGYDPVELFLDPAIPFVEGEDCVAFAAKETRLPHADGRGAARRALVKGSHGGKPKDEREWPVCLSGRCDLLPAGTIASTAVYDLLLRHLGKT